MPTDPRWPLRGVLLLALIGAACTMKLPPHVWLPIPRVEAVDLFWWTETRQCTMRTLYWDQDRFKGFTVPVEAGLCLAWLKAEGYDVTSVMTPNPQTGVESHD